MGLFFVIPGHGARPRIRCQYLFTDYTNQKVRSYSKWPCTENWGVKNIRKRGQGTFTLPPWRSRLPLNQRKMSKYSAILPKRSSKETGYCHLLRSRRYAKLLHFLVSIYIHLFRTSLNLIFINDNYSDLRNWQDRCIVRELIVALKAVISSTSERYQGMLWAKAISLLLCFVFFCFFSQESNNVPSTRQ